MLFRRIDGLESKGVWANGLLIQSPGGISGALHCHCLRYFSSIIFWESSAESLLIFTKYTPED